MPQFQNITIILAVVSVLTLLQCVGCSSGDRLSAGGTVTLDGIPLESGTISFQPSPGSEGHSAGGQIQGGKFQIESQHGIKPGTYLVKIQSFKSTGRMVIEPQTKQQIPEQVMISYKESGQLQVTVEPGVANHFDFKLTSAVGESR